VKIQTAGTPFHSLDALPFTEDFHIGLGGHRTLRGYRQDRFVGRTMAATTAELRWTFWRFRAVRQKVALIAVPFFDLGRSFDSSKALTVSDWRAGYGGALRVSWNLATVITDGIRAMPAQDLGNREVDDVIAYLRATFGD
jgi:outer membrane protein assembly factor BamA